MRGNRERVLKLTLDGKLISPERWEFTPGDVRVSRLLAKHLPAPAGPPPPPDPGTVLDWIEGAWTYAATPAAHERPVWREVIEAAREQGTPYPLRHARRRP